MKSIQPINDNVLLKQIEETENTTRGGIVIPDSAKEKPSQGEVIGISPDIESPLSVGDTVIFKKYSGTETSMDGNDYIIVPLEDILARIVEVDAIPD